jgi:hypothetical protein
MTRAPFFLFYYLLTIVKAFAPLGRGIKRKESIQNLRSVSLFESNRIIDDSNQNNSSNNSFLERRSFLDKVVTSCTSGTILFLGNDILFPGKAFAKSTTDVNTLLSQLKEARAQLEPIPALIKEEKWDSVRAILITPPLADCWAKTSKPLLKQYAEAQDDLPNGDELTALELREEALDHLRFLDMAVYNNVFNPIKTEGETGATKELIRSYYDDPVKEYQASVKVLDELISLSK